MRYDLAVIGSGGAAFAAAISANEQGADVVMVERDQIGGTCVNVGCVPSKSLLAAAAARHTAATQSFPGIETHGGPVDAGRLTSGKDGLVDQLRAAKYVDLAAECGWEIVAGTATFGPGPVLDVALTGGGARRIEAEHYVVATGAEPRVPDIPGLAGTGHLTSGTALDLDRLPDSLIVLGGNAIGLELAQLFARLGSQVTIVEVRDRLAPFDEREIGAAIETVFADEGITVCTAAEVTAVSRHADQYRVQLAASGQVRELRARQLLVATGRRPVTTGLNLRAVDVSTGSRGEIVVDHQHRTGNPRIWAAGDVTGGPQFVYVAAAQGNLVAANALSGARRGLDYTALPRVTFTSPAIASVGLTDQAAADAGLRCDCRVLPLASVPRALVNRDTRGLIKIVADAATGRLLGVHALADNAGDVIAAAGYALGAGLTVDQLASAWTPYLTMAEGLRLAAQAYTRDIDRLSCCAA